jgi:uncharacterized RDD family membrane protein YckC
MLDTRRTIETPEGVELALRAAGPAVRFYAWLIDFAIRLAFYVIFAVTLPLLGNLGVGIYLIIIFLLEWFYPVVFEVLRNGATPGKKAMGVRVVHDDGTEVGWQAAVIRNLLRAADFLPVCYAIGLVSMLMTRDFRRLGDLAAGTLVVYRDDPPPQMDIAVAVPLAPPVPLTAPEQYAVLQFAERYSALNPERANELAETLTALTTLNGDTPSERLLRYANWLVGRR